MIFQSVALSALPDAKFTASHVFLHQKLCNKGTLLSTYVAEKVTLNKITT
jgi:hypothetical protein